MIRSDLKNGDDPIVGLGFTKDRDRYVFIFNRSSQDTFLRAMGRFASDPELNFMWKDAAILREYVSQLLRWF